MLTEFFLEVLPKNHKNWKVEKQKWRAIEN
jgi:hypothetical protein